MPAYNSQATGGAPLQALWAGSPIGVAVWNADTQAFVTANTKSLAVAVPANATAAQKKLSIEVSFSAAPGNFSIQPQTADTDQDGFYVNEGSPFTQATLNAGGLNVRLELTLQANFFRLLMGTPQGNNVTVTAKIWAH